VTRSWLFQLGFTYTPDQSPRHVAPRAQAPGPRVTHGARDRARGKLYNVIVEDERASERSSSNGAGKKRVTLIPPNKIRAFKHQDSRRNPKCMPYRPSLFRATDDHVSNPTDFQKLKSARPLAPCKVRLALSLIGYLGEVAEAIAVMFNDTLICDYATSAQAVRFARHDGVRDITLDGDVY
jgi:structural maintenance of chromosome 2